MTARAGDAAASFRQSLEGSERQEAMELPSKPAAVLVSQSPSSAWDVQQAQRLDVPVPSLRR